MKIKNITSGTIFGANNQKIAPGDIAEVADQIGELMIKKSQAKKVEVKVVKKRSD